MDPETIILGIGLLGALAIVWGLYNLFGSVNSFYIIGYVHLTLAMYMLILGGTFFVLLCLGSYFPTPISLYILNSGIVIAIVGTIIMWMPRMQPKWLQWLKKEHGDILDILQQEIRKEPYWNRRINTQEELQAWVEEVRYEHGI